MKNGNQLPLERCPHCNIARPHLAHRWHFQTKDHSGQNHRQWFFYAGMSWRDFMAFAREMDAVGTALDLPEPEKIDLFKSTKFSIKNGKPSLPMGAYYY